MVRSTAASGRSHPHLAWKHRAVPSEQLCVSSAVEVILS